MKKRKAAAAGILAAVLFFVQTAVGVQGGNESPGELYALSAVLMDGDSGRVLYGKKEEVPRANASTTKVLTCILALENAPGDDYVQISQKAARQPEVKLGLREGEQYYLEDLLYSLMLKSHNDTAVAIAEHVGGTVEGFSELMDCKAKEIGCENTHFVTPNGLDGSDKKGIHHTTAKDLARIMSYAIKNEMFRKIAQTKEYTFQDIEKKREHHVQNTNALLDMREGVIAGKTGFTGNAGYCYVCAVKKEEKTLIVALLGCGWPNHKGYKWKDTETLLSYGERNFQKKPLWKDPGLSPVPVTGGAGRNGRLKEKIFVEPVAELTCEEKKKEILVGPGEKITMRTRIKKELEAPVKKGEKLGEIQVLLEGVPVSSCDLKAGASVERVTYRWYVEQVFSRYFH